MCTQHRQPRSECEPWDKHGHTMRFREDTWQESMDAAGTDELTAWTSECLEARRDRIRCRRCPDDAPVIPMEPGDMTGRPFSEWLADAVLQVYRQHPRHEPVWLGAAPSGPAPAVFMPPMPAAAPDSGSKRGRARG